MTKYLRSSSLLAILILLSFCTGKEQESSPNDNPSLAVAEASTNNQIDIKEWPVPWDGTRPRDPAVAPDGKVWFCGQAGNYIAYLEPGSNDFKRYEVPQRTHPHNLIIDKQGFIWYAGNQNAHIGKLDPTNGTITKYAMPDEEAKDPHTLIFNQQGDIWFTVQGGNFVGLLNTTSGTMRLVSVATEHARPYGIKVDSKNRPWIALFGTNKLASVNPETFQIREIELPHKDSRPRRLEINSQDKIFYVDYTRGFVGKYDPDLEGFEEWPLPGGKDSRPYGTAIDKADRMWIAEAGLSPNRLVGFNTKTEEFFSRTRVPSGGGVIRHMYYQPEQDEVWFGTDKNTIGRARVGL